jgi:hypothetical protein
LKHDHRQSAPKSVEALVAFALKFLVFLSRITAYQAKSSTLMQYYDSAYASPQKKIRICKEHEYL